VSAVEGEIAVEGGAPADVVVPPPVEEAAAPAVVEPPATPPVAKGSSRRSAAAAAKAEAAAAPPAVVPDTAAELAEARAEIGRVTAESAAKDFKHAVERAGVEPEGHDIVQHLYDQVKAPEGGEKPTLAAWLADRANLPKAVQAYLPSAAPIGDPPIPAPEPVVLPDDNAGARPPPSGATLSAAAIANMIGNPAVYAQNRDAVMATLGGKLATVR
jgi:hypothetical protein